MSNIIVSAIGRPNCDRSYGRDKRERAMRRIVIYLDVVPFVVITTLSEKAVRNDLMYIEFVKNWISILCKEWYEYSSTDVGEI